MNTDMKSAMADAGLIFDGEVKADGELHRIHIIGDHPGDNNGWYVLYPDYPQNGSYGCWKRGIEYKWTSTAKPSLLEFWGSLREPSRHPYLTKKGIPPGNIKVDDNLNRLIVPLYNINNVMISYQSIFADGSKKFASGRSVKGNFHIIGSIGEAAIIYLAEGYATGMTVHQATNLPVVCALFANNIPHVAKIIREQYQDAVIIIAADNDAFTDGNPGLKYANLAAKETNSTVFSPDFTGCDLSSKPTDYNDLLLLTSLATVKEQLAPKYEILKEDTIKQLPILNPGGFIGILADIAKLSQIESEASSAAVAAHVIAYLAAMIGNNIYQRIGRSRIYCRPFFLLVGKSGFARKGTSEQLAKCIFERVNAMIPMSALAIHRGGLSSGEGLVYLLRDPSEDGKDQGIEDKRLLVVEQEFVNVLNQCRRDTSTLSNVLRTAYDGCDLKPATKHNRVTCTNPHIVLMAHVTQHELLARTSSIDANNGLLNRFMILSVHRERLMPNPPENGESEIESFAAAIVSIVRFASKHMQVTLDQDAIEYWNKLYPSLNEELAGDLGALNIRSAQQCRMIAMLFAVMELKIVIGVKHIHAAALWMMYCYKSVEYIFGEEKILEENKRNSTLANKILDFLKTEELSRTDISNKLKRNVSAEKIKEALTYLLNSSPPKISQRMEKLKTKEVCLYKAIE